MSFIRWPFNYGAGPMSRWHETRSDLERTFCGSKPGFAARIELRAMRPKENVCERCQQVRRQHERGLRRPHRARRYEQQEAS